MVGGTSPSVICSHPYGGDFPVGSLKHKGRKLVTSSRVQKHSIGFKLPRLTKVSVRCSQHSSRSIGGVADLNLTTGRRPSFAEDSNPSEACEALLKSLTLSSIPSELKNLEADHEEKVTFPFYAAVTNRFCDMLEGVLLWAFYGSRKPTNFYMLGNYAPVEESAPRSVNSVKGDVPECLNGEYIQVGPNARVMPLAKYHWFDGDGMLHGLRIKDGEVTYACRYVRTSRLKQEEYWGASKFWKSGDFVGFEGLLCAGISFLREKLGALDMSKGDGTANTSLVYHNGTLFALCERDLPYVVHILDGGDFKTISRHDFDKKLDHYFTAHPKIDPDTGEMFSYGYTFEGAPYLTYNLISPDGKMGDPVPITLPGPRLVHDVAITDDYVVFAVCPLQFDPKGMIMKKQFAIAHTRNAPFLLGLLPKYAKDETEMIWFEFTSAINFHIANGWQEGDEILLVTCRMPKVDMLRITDACPRLHEYRLNLKTGETSERRLGESDADFPTMNNNYLGKKSRYIYAATRTASAVEGSSDWISGIVKYDLSQEPEFYKEKLRVQVGGNVAGVFWLGDRRCGMQPLFVPRKSGTDSEEDDGYILWHIFDENTSKSEVLVINAKTMAPDPVAVIEMPSRVPYGFHSLFVSEEQLHSQRGPVY